MNETGQSAPKPGECIPWDIKREDFSTITGDEEQIKKVWQDVDAMGYMYVWHCLLSF